MTQFLKKHWIDIAWLAGYLAGCALLTWVIGPFGLVVGFAVGVIFCIHGGLASKWVKVTALAVLVPIIILASLKAYDYAKKIEWYAPEAPDAVAITPKKAGKAADYEEADTALMNLAEEVSKMRHEFGTKLDAVMKQTAPPTMPRTFAPFGSSSPVAPKIEWGPALPVAPPEPAEEEEKPKGNLLPNTEPKEALPDLLVQTRKQRTAPADEPKTHVLGTCGRAHRITGWTIDGEPIYGPCYDLHGNACGRVKLGTMYWD